MKVFNAVLDYLFGPKYYANIVNTIGTTKCEICSYIFKTKEQALKHKNDVDNLVSFKYIETISFRSKNDFTN